MMCLSDAIRRMSASLTLMERVPFRMEEWKISVMVAMDRCSYVSLRIIVKRTKTHM
jgi:hypothetical protein